jgi:hypothetical protein
MADWTQPADRLSHGCGAESRLRSGISRARSRSHLGRRLLGRGTAAGGHAQFVQVSDPVDLGIVASLARPGRNITGFTHFELAFAGKWLETLKDMAPQTRRVLLVTLAEHPALPGFLRTITALESSSGVKATPAGVRHAAEIECAIDDFTREPNGGLIVLPSQIATTHRELIIALRPEPPMKWDGYPNLRKRPPTPAKARGSIQRAIRRAFAATSASALTSTQIYDWAHVRRRLGRRKSMPFGVYSRTLRTLKVMCYRVGRGTSIGRPWLWRLRNTADD